MKAILAPLIAWLLLAAPAQAATPITCPEWTESTNPFKEGHEETLGTTPIVTATSTEPGAYEAHIVASDYEFAIYGSPAQELQALTWALDWPHEVRQQRITVYTGLSYEGEATIRLAGLHPGRWETVATARFGGGGFGPSFNWVPFQRVPVQMGLQSCETLGGVGGAEVQ